LVVTDSGIEVAVGRVLSITPTPDGVVIVQNEWDGGAEDMDGTLRRGA
jgi:hypothetical protein